MRNPHRQRRRHPPTRAHHSSDSRAAAHYAGRVGLQNLSLGLAFKRALFLALISSLITFTHGKLPKCLKQTGKFTEDTELNCIFRHAHVKSYSAYWEFAFILRILRTK